MINMKRYAGGKSPYELFSEAVDRKDKNGADTIELNAMKHKIEIEVIGNKGNALLRSWDYIVYTHAE